MENKIYLFTLIGNFVNMNVLPDDILDELYPLLGKVMGDNGDLNSWWDEMFRRSRSRNQNLKNN